MTIDFRVISFVDGKRGSMAITKDELEEAKTKVRLLREKGYRATIVRVRVSRLSRNYFPPEDEVVRMRNEGMLWCPYCRSWRWFRIPRTYPDADVGTRHWFLNAQANQLIRICSWCEISVQDFHVCKVNSIFEEVTGVRRRHRNRRRKSRNA